MGKLENHKKTTHMSPFPAGELKAARNRQGGMTKTNPNEISEGVKKNNAFTTCIRTRSRNLFGSNRQEIRLSCM